MHDDASLDGLLVLMYTATSIYSNSECGSQDGDRPKEGRLFRKETSNGGYADGENISTSFK